MSRVALVEPMAFLLPVPLEWSKTDRHQGAGTHAWCVVEDKKNHNPTVFFGKLNRLQLEMRTVAIK